MPEMKETPTSSNVYSVGHDPATNTLYVQFRSAKDKRMPASIFTYRKVTAEQYREMLAAPSVGSHFHEHIKKHPDKHPVSKRE